MAGRHNLNARLGRLAKRQDGRPLCRWCREPVQKPRRTFCSDDCVHEWKLRSDPGYLRRLVEDRDKGVCAECGADTVNQYAELKALRKVDTKAWRTRLDELSIPPNRTVACSLWDADHIKPVAEGGDSTLDNVQTLCLACHRKKTNAQIQRKKEARRRASEPHTGS